MLTEQLSIPNAPALPGLTFRRLRGEADYAGLASVVNASNAADRIEETVSAADIAHGYEHPADDDAPDNVLVAELDSEPVAYAYVWTQISLEDERLYRHRGYIRPEWRRKGLGRALFGWAEARLREIAARHPDDHRPRLLQVMGEDTALGRLALLEQNGYAPVRYWFFMQRTLSDDLPAVSLPHGLEFRPVRTEHWRAIWEAKEEAFADHWGHIAKTEADYVDWTHSPRHDATLWLIAWDGDAVAGLSLNMINADDNAQYGFRRGEVASLGVRRPWRGRGLGRALLVGSLHVLRERGMTEAVLGVDADNPTGALKLYASAGFRALNKDALYRKPLA